MKHRNFRLKVVLAVAALVAMAFLLPRLSSALPEAAQEASRYRSGGQLGRSAESSVAGRELAAGATEMALPENLFAGAEADQALFDDLTVQGGEVIDGGVVVYDGDARVKSGGVIDGDLVVYSGDIRIDEGGRVQGDVSTFAGDIRVSGDVGGNLTTWRGDVQLRSGASVGGDVSVVNGDVRRDEGAEVGGNVVRGPRLALPQAPVAPFAFGGPGAAAANSVADASSGLVGRIGAVILRLMGMALLSLLVGAGVWVIAQVRPATIHGTRATLTEQPALSFIVGILTNVVLLLAGMVFAITICLMPLTLLTYLLLIGLNVVGWAALSYVVSQRLTERYDLSMRWDVAMAVTAAAMFAVLGVLWALGGCFRFFAFAGILVTSSVGAGAVLLPILNRFMGSSAAQLPEVSTAPRDPQRDAMYETYLETASEETTEAEATVDDVSAAMDEAMESAASPDDMQRIRGIGPVAADRLASAGITSYAELAGMSPEAIGGILNWSRERVENADIAGQAYRLAQGLT